MCAASCLLLLWKSDEARAEKKHNDDAFKKMSAANGGMPRTKSISAGEKRDLTKTTYKWKQTFSSILYDICYDTGESSFDHSVFNY